MDVSETVAEREDDLLNDDGELDDQPINDLVNEPPDADPVHLAKCAECATAVKFRSNVTGTGFFLVDEAPDATFGVGEHGRPVCPNGHGEMSIADEQIAEAVPVAEAFAQVAAKSDGPVQRALPGVFPPFNYEGVFREIVEQAQRVETLKADYEAAKSEASDAKKALDKGSELLMRMTLEFERRRREKPDPEATEAKRAVVACIWTQAHPEDPCPFCDPPVSLEQRGTAEQRAAIVAVLGAEILPPQANGHADQVVEYRTRLDVAATVDALDGHVYDVHPATVAEWSTEDRAAVRAWATDPDSTYESLPSVLGKPHVAAIVGEDAKVQACMECGAVLRTFDDPDEALSVGALVRTDCPGAQPEPEHHYPERGKKKPARKAAGGDEKPTKQPAAKKGKKGGR